MRRRLAGGHRLPPGFDEAAYLAANPDVRQAVLAGTVRSGAAHYRAAGGLEGRPLSVTAARPDAGSPAQGFTAGEERAGDHWDRMIAQAGGPPPRAAWWTDPPTIRHINRLVCGEAIDGLHAGFHREIVKRLGPAPGRVRRAISVGCGAGGKELALLQTGAVGEFDCYDVSAEAVEAGRRLAREHGVGDRMRFHRADAFDAALGSDHDLVYWNNALHHMFDTHRAVAWSRERLGPGGLFAMDDYVGAPRFQHADAIMDWAALLLALLPDRLLAHWDAARATTIPRRPGRHDPQALATMDPSEAVDSQNILPAIRSVFPGAEIIRTGGTVYFIALCEAFQNFDSAEDLRLLDALLAIDHAVAQREETQYAVAFARRDWT